jgi:hypothetical protein
MTLETKLTQIERQLWKNDVELYACHLLDDATLVFAETGPIPKNTALDAIRAENAEGRRWAEVEFYEVRCRELTENVALLTYRVAARWEHEKSSISALASSVYIQREGTWLLTFHQQTPLPAP